MPTQNKALIFKKVPTGYIVPGEHVTIEDRPIDLDQAPPENGLIVQNIYASFDPYQRGRMRDASIKSYAPPFTLDAPITNSTISKVLKSSNSGFQEGDLTVILGAGPTEEYSVFAGDFVKSSVKKVDNPNKIDPVHFIGAAGMPGLTAYSSFYEIGEPKKGETIFISAASGAVGSIVGQLAKHEGLRVIGSVGDDEKLKYILDDLKFDGGFNYKKEKPADALKRLAPDGVDIYYENVGGEQLEAAIDAANQWARFVMCGMISQYNVSGDDRYPIRNMMLVVGKRLRMQGFIVGDANMGPKYGKKHNENVTKWIADGSFKAKVHITEGIDNAAEGLVGIFKGNNFGKAVVRLAKP